ncbi:hypothetical protein BDP27DRAFT_1172568, partial [Rhodocollybia butyracea]
LETASSKIRNSLPGYLPLYIGMPVVLRNKNIDTNLGITNGARGYLRSLDMSVDSNGFTFCTGALVEFPDSKVTLEGLPPRYFPIKPINWRFSTTVDDPIRGVINVQVIRSQLPIQPGFAVTGHSSQGQ